MTEIIDYMNEALRRAVRLCTEGKYRHNRNPAVAALFDPDPLVRAGAAFLLTELLETQDLMTENTRPSLRLAIKHENDGKVRVIMEAMLERIEKVLSKKQLASVDKRLLR